MKRRDFLSSVAAIAFTGITSGVQAAQSQGNFRIGLILPMTGPFASTGKQIESAVRLYLAQYGDSVAGKKLS